MRSGSPTNSISPANTHISPPGSGFYSNLDIGTSPGDSLSGSLSQGTSPFPSDTTLKAHTLQTPSQFQLSTTAFQVATYCENTIYGSGNGTYEFHGLLSSPPIPSDHDWSAGTRPMHHIPSPNSRAPWSPGPDFHTRDQIIEHPWNSPNQFGAIEGAPSPEFRHIQDSGLGHSSASGNIGISCVGSEQVSAGDYEGTPSTQELWQFDVSCPMRKHLQETLTRFQEIALHLNPEDWRETCSGPR